RRGFGGARGLAESLGSRGAPCDTGAGRRPHRAHPPGGRHRLRRTRFRLRRHYGSAGRSGGCVEVPRFDRRATAARLDRSRCEEGRRTEYAASAAGGRASRARNAADAPVDTRGPGGHVVRRPFSRGRDDAATRTSTDRPRRDGWTPRWTRSRAVVPGCGYGGRTSLPYTRTARRHSAEPRVLGSHLPTYRRIHGAALRGLRDPG